MDTIGSLFHGFAVALTPGNLLAVLVGSIIGTVIGVLPGLGPTASIALLLPVTIGMDMVPALIMLAGIYYGAMYGGSTTSILVNIPGEAAPSSRASTGTGWRGMAERARRVACRRSAPSSEAPSVWWR